MPQTLTEKILSRAAGYPVQAGDLAMVKIDFAMVQDINGPRVVEVLDELQVDRLFDPERVMFVFDHYSPEPTPLASNFHTQMRAVAEKFGVSLRDVGAGICHQLVVEAGAARPGAVVVGTDSHSSTYGALGAFGVSLGATEMAVALMSGETWFKVPRSVKVNLIGSPPAGVSGKDIALHLLKLQGEEGGLYQSFEFQGSGLAAVPVHDRLTIANLVVDCGAKAGIFTADEVTRAWFASRGFSAEGFEAWRPDDDAEYQAVLTIDLSDLEPVVAVPHSPASVVPLSNVRGTSVTTVFIGTCTNGRIEDYQAACAVLKGRRVAPGVRLLCYPASRDIQLELLHTGMAQILVEAGAVLMPPGCGPCAGLHGGVAGDDDVIFSTSSRNYRGRMGASGAQIYLGSPAVAAATAVTGRITDPQELVESDKVVV